MKDTNGDGTRSTAAEALILRMVAAHADSLLRTARRHSICLDDAQDAYQHAIEIFMREAHRLDAARAPGWLHVVVKREAQALRKERQRFLISEPIDLDGHEATDLPTPEERLLRFDMISRSAEALKRLKPQELRALWLRAQGHSYCEIGAMTGWSYTKINRCLAEGRRNFLERYERIESGDECERWMPVISAMVDGEASPEQILELRPHLRNCPGCRATLKALRDSSGPLAAVFPVPLLAVAADGGDQVSGVVMRLYEAISGGLHERAVHSVTKAQAVLEMAAAGKVTAVAASAAAVAGGGYATVEQVIERPPAVVRRVAQTRAHHPQRAPRRPARVTSTATTAPVVPASAPASASPARLPDVREAPRRQEVANGAAFSATQVDTGTEASAAFEGQAHDEAVDYSTRVPRSSAVRAARASGDAARPPAPPPPAASASGQGTTSRSSSSATAAAFATAEQQAGFAP
jgi:DNA-directed RNA polymerase specialized sigma24 family protein